MKNSFICSIGLAAIAVTTPLLGVEGGGTPPLTLLPLPAQIRSVPGRLAVTAGFSVAVRGHDDARLRGALARTLRRWEERSELTLARTATSEFVIAPAGSAATLTIECAGPGPALPQPGEDESYTLEVVPDRATLRAPSVTGALRGLATLTQLLQVDASGWFLPAVSIEDRPRFPWRGLLIDVCRHWEPMDVILRNLDGMALVKLNVLHFHLSEDQGFRIESKKYPRLQEFGSDGHYFTQEQIREIVAYAAARGIRVMPEFDLPGHSTSWLVGYPELASGPGPFVIGRRWGIEDPTFDPTNEAVYALFDGFFGEMAALFPDPYMHIGGDEVSGKQWNANARIQAFIREHDLKDNHGLQAHFNRRMQEIMARHGKKMIGWDEILHPGLPAGTMVQSWRGTEGLVKAAQAGFAGILSNGYYFNSMNSAGQHYAVDPLPADTPLTPAQQQLVFGGEACMWGEYVSPETIDSRIWPRLAAIAERLWSPREVKDPADMYRRLAIVGRRLEETGLRHEKYRPAMLRQWFGDGADDATQRDLEVLAGLLEPAKRYRSKTVPTQFTPLTGILDSIAPESVAAREFAAGVNRFVFAVGQRDRVAARSLDAQLGEWRALAQRLGPRFAAGPARMRELAPLLKTLDDSCLAGSGAISALLTQPKGKAVPDVRPAKSGTPVDLAIIPAIRLLTAACGVEAQRATLPPDEWRQLVEKLVAPAPAR